MFWRALLALLCSAPLPGWAAPRCLRHASVSAELPLPLTLCFRQGMLLFLLLLLLLLQSS